jgi:hypothetical protein
MTTTEKYPFGPYWHMVIDPQPEHVSYKSPRNIPSAAMAPTRQVRLEVVLLHGSGCSFRPVPARHRTMVRTFGGLETLQDLLYQTLLAFKPASYGSLGELRIPMDGLRCSNDETRWPMKPSDTVLRLQEHDDHHGDDDSIEGWDVLVSNVLCQGVVAYLRFDYSDEWWWRVRALPPAAPLTGADLTPALSFVEGALPDHAPEPCSAV